MAAADFLQAFLVFNVAAAAAVLLILVLRTPVRHVFGAAAAYRLWLIAPLAAAATLLPARVVFQVIEPSGRLTILPDAQSDWLALDWPFLIASAWAVGAVFSLALLCVRQWGALACFGGVRAEGEVWRAEREAVGPALVGLFRPRIIVPADFETRFTVEERGLVLAHERTHQAGGDLWINASAALAQCLLWCNPFVHVAAKQLRVDQELACDSAVLARFPDQRRAYAAALLKTQITEDLPQLACAWPAGASSLLKERIAMLKDELPSGRRRFIGAVMTATLGAAAAGAAWAAQPPETVPVAPPAPPAPTKTIPLAPDVVATEKGDVFIIRKVPKGDVKRIEIDKGKVPPELSEALDGNRVFIRRVEGPETDVFALRTEGKDAPDMKKLRKDMEKFRKMSAEERKAWVEAHGAKTIEISDMRYDGGKISAEARDRAIESLERQRDALDRAIARLRAGEPGPVTVPLAPLAPLPPGSPAPAPMPAPTAPR